MSRIQRALISVTDKTGIVEFARGLSNQGAEILSTGGTHRILKEAGIAPLETEPAPEATPERIAAGYALYTNGGCASCHGENGHGDGLAAQALPVKPRDFTRGRFHRGSSAADIHETLMTGLDGTPMASFAKVMSPEDLWNVSLFVHRLSPTMNERAGVRCPDIVRPFDLQELFGVRNMMSTTHRLGALELAP